MTITADEAAAVAERHGLTLSDAQALSVLASDRDHADQLAARFANAPGHDGNGTERGRREGLAEARRRFGANDS